LIILFSKHGLLQFLKKSNPVIVISCREKPFDPQSAQVHGTSPSTRLASRTMVSMKNTQALPKDVIYAEKFVSADRFLFFVDRSSKIGPIFSMAATARFVGS
jgi:hypothetical protein